MITLHIAKLLQNNGFGTLALTGSETGNNLIYWEKLPLGKTGVYIMSNGDALSRGRRMSQTFNIYARGVNDIDGAKRLKAILSFFNKECYPSCDLPIVAGYSEDTYSKTIILPTSNISNVGLDNTDRIIYSITAQIIYKEEN